MDDTEHDIEELLADVKKGQKNINTSLDTLFKKLKDIGIEA